MAKFIDIKKISSKSEQKYFFASILINIVLHTFQMILRKKTLKKVVDNVFDHFFCEICFHLLRIFWNRSEFELNRSKITFFVDIFNEKFRCLVTSQKLEVKILLNEKIQKNWKIGLAYVSEHCASFRTKISIWPLLSPNLQVGNH